jgi:hypothetical protein
MKEKLLDKRNPEAEAYANLMATRLRAVKREIKPKSSIQCASTQSLIERDPALDAQMKLRIPDPEKYKTLHPSLVERKIDVQEFLLIEGMRRSVKNTIGQSDQSATTPERKEKAINAFMYSQPAELTIEQMHKLTEMNKITEYTGPVPQTKKKNWLDLIKDLFGKGRVDLPRSLSYMEKQELFREKK